MHQKKKKIAISFQNYLSNYLLIFNAILYNKYDD